MENDNTKTPDPEEVRSTETAGQTVSVAAEATENKDSAQNGEDGS